jgi:hypothetical protein
VKARAHTTRTPHRPTYAGTPQLGHMAGQLLALQRSAGNQAVSRMVTVQRFGTQEHKLMGDKGSGVGRVVLAPGLEVSFGDVTALAGDYFGSVAQIQALARTKGDGRTIPGTRDELHYALFVKLWGKETDAGFGPEVIKAVTQRYYTLAGTNRTHFTNPAGAKGASVDDLANARDASPVSNKVEEAYGKPPELTKGGVATTNAGSYRENHALALEAAARAGRTGRSKDEAMLYEAFASHFQTDAFSAGHIRTPRDAISSWWNVKQPMFWTNVKLWMAERIAQHLNDHSNAAGVLTVQQLWGLAQDTLRSVLTSKGIPDLTFGDVVAGAVHDRDNEQGVDAMVGPDVVPLLGDGEILKKGKETAKGAATMKAVTAALKVSVDEVHKAYDRGKAGLDPAKVADGMRIRGLSMRPGLFAAEQLWPMALDDTDSRQGHSSLDWKQPDIDALFRDPEMREALRIFANAKADDLGSEITLDPPLRAAKETALRESVLKLMRGDEQTVVTMLHTVATYTPGSGGGSLGGVLGHDADDNALEYYQEAKAKRALATLTLMQKVSLIRGVLSGATVGNEETMIIDLLLTKPADIPNLVNIVTWTWLWDDLGGSSLRRLVHDVGPRYWRTQGFGHKYVEMKRLVAGSTGERAEELVIVILRTCTREQVRSAAAGLDLDGYLDGAEQRELDLLRR